MTIRFDDRVAIVTGAGAGLGRTHALFLAERGAKLVINDLGGTVDGRGGTEAAADKVVAEIKAAGGESVANHDNVADPGGAAAVVRAAMEAFGRVDILINNAGILRDKTFAKMEVADFDAVVGVHLMGSVYCTHAAWPIMMENGYGRIVLTTSAAGLYGNFGQTNYAAAKLALVGFMNALKLEGEKYDIKVNTIAPIAATRMTEGIMPAPMAALMQPEFTTPMVAYLCSDACQATGAVIEAGAGHFAAVEMMEAPGVSFGTEKPPTPEDIADRFDDIRDMNGAQSFARANDALSKVLAAVTGR